MLDLALKLKVETELAKRARRFATSADVMAIIDKESGGVPIFRGTEPLFRQNLAAASKISGLAPERILEAVKIQAGPYKGMIAKFRCEPGYFAWAQRYAKTLRPEDVFLLSCSFGLGQKMTRWLVSGIPLEEWIPTIKNFMGSVNTQILYVCGDIDSLLVGSGGDRPLAFTRYNAGPNASAKSPAYKAYGLPVTAKATALAKEID